MGRYEFETDKESEEFCDEICEEMVRIFGISLDDAAQRLNKHWKGLSLLGEYDLIYHEIPEYWARHIYEITQKDAGEPFDPSQSARVRSDFVETIRQQVAERDCLATKLRELGVDPTLL